MKEEIESKKDAPVIKSSRQGKVGLKRKLLKRNFDGNSVILHVHTLYMCLESTFKKPRREVAKIPNAPIKAGEKAKMKTSENNRYPLSARSRVKRRKVKRG